MNHYTLRLRTLSTGGAGSLGSHLCKRLLAKERNVTCLDNFFTGKSYNLLHLLDNQHFKQMRHDVTFPLYVKVDEFYNPACPDSLSHYQHDPVQTPRPLCMEPSK